MTQTDIPDSLRQMVREMADRIASEAYSAGYLKGADDTAQRILAAVNTTVPHARSAGRTSATKAVSAATPRRETHPNSMDTRRFPYGAVANAFRDELRLAGAFGVTKEELVRRVSIRLGDDVSGMDHRDTLKRLKRAEELRVFEGRYFAGMRLARKENGAVALPLPAPETGGGATPPIDSQAVERLIG